MDGRKTVVGLGFFDGLHIGHRELIRRVKVIATENRLDSVIFTFSEHPNVALGKAHNTKLLMTNKRKNDLILEMGIDQVIFERFTPEIAGMSPEEFASEILSKRICASKVVIGFNYHFGKQGAGNAKDLIDFGKKYGFEVEVVNPVYFEDELVSSTLIRRLIEGGEMRRVSILLSRPFELLGVVTEGKRLGSKMNFPTANIFPQENIITPMCGVYATVVEIAGDNFFGVTNVGTNPTITSDDTVVVETHIFDFNKDIYGKEILVKFVEMIRPEVKFDDVNKLFAQIAKDAREAKGILYAEKSLHSRD